ncbi:hypothetical protein [Thermotalea metallivorans]|uniref:DUF8052 domain-containing protein n=1 Tax=Thermotalea metallivorans TaxID=520762 RepID=A0A140L3E8_9FIRM|nr:hypothetical protein [Thermotalea metallivorans]KXG75073.1 hypothetical protein AN619_18990 [Thermotalea metallivorans]
MKTAEYLDLLESRYRKYFDIEKNTIYQGMKLDLFARSFIRNERYIASKKLTIYAYENNEYCFIKQWEILKEDQLHQFMDLLKSAIDDYVIPHEEHMSSIITGVLLSEKEPDRELQRLVKKFKFHKSFSFGFKGWADIRLILVALDRGEVIANKKGEEVLKFYKIF